MTSIDAHDRGLNYAETRYRCARQHFLTEPNGSITLAQILGQARFQAKWRPVRVKKTRQIKNLEPRFDSIETGF
jgi:hypothetical protein